MTKYPSQLQDKFNLRFPDGMREAIAERAKLNGRSMNSEIIQIIEDAIKRDAIIEDALEQRGDIRLDESKVSELEQLQEKIIAVQKSENSLLKRQIEILRRMADDKKPT
ncbi:Arc family DNA-binding protein [Yokenella regensburgei]|uniref:Arc family DNA-binding protein n=1 Tax=Yokenella regensburgei TaxID=158877 RepID=UPI001433067D|nr:Arc family DNA-binding protein [Yokenella regensburgei]QIU92156.1 Arc family DNA-binding protein [Yokenella regensburgei]